MAKHGDSGLGFEIVKAVNMGEILEPITFDKVKRFCKHNDIEASENHMRVILSNSSQNTHSPTYKKYFQRVGRGEYMVLPTYKNAERYFWLNVDSFGYEWTFSDIKVGKCQTYSNYNPDGNKRKNPKCFEEIKVGDLVVAYETGQVKAISTLCKVVDKYEDDNEIFVEFQKVREFNTVLKWDALRRAEGLKDSDPVHFHRGTLFELKKEHYEMIVQMLEEINPLNNMEEELYQEIKQAMKKSKIERKRHLENKNSPFPEEYEVTTRAFKRDAFVIAEVLLRANGICERCGEEAPFKRATDGTPYLEVHHKKWLSKGGEDTVDNTIAVCPNCHRELHFG